MYAELSVERAAEHKTVNQILMGAVTPHNSSQTTAHLALRRYLS